MCNRLPSRLGLAATSSLSSMGLAATGRGHCGAAGRAGGCQAVQDDHGRDRGCALTVHCRLARVPCRRAPRPAGATACRAPRANGRSRDVKRERETYGGTLDATISICLHPCSTTFYLTLRSRLPRRSATCFASARSCFFRSLNPGDARKLTSATWRSEYNSSTRPASTADRNCAGT